MSWRTVVISNRAKLDLKLNHLVVRQAEETIQIYLDEIALLMIESTAVSITTALLSEMIKYKIKIIFCDEKRNPISELVSYYGSFDSSKKIRNQIKWCSETKKLVWTEIVRNKILNQLLLLEKFNFDQKNILLKYLKELELNDATNREGHAAKVYFNTLFGNEFSRGQDNIINACLNYGYSILLSTINREIAANGYLTQLGIFHRSETNPFNLGSDLIEPWRVIIDDYVFNNQPEKFDKETKRDLVGLLHNRIKIDNKNQTVLNGIKLYCKSVFDSLENDDIRLILNFQNES